MAVANVLVTITQPNVSVSSDNVNVSVSQNTSNVTIGNTSLTSNSDIRQAISISNVSGFGNLAYDSTANSNGIIQYTGVSTADIRGQLSNTAPITYDSSTGVIGLEQTLDDLTLKKYQETVVANGNVSGNISAEITNGTIHTYTLSGDVTGITLSNIATGGSATLFLKQSPAGGNEIDTTTHASNWTNWEFANESSVLDTNPNAWNTMTVIYDGTDYYASIIQKTSETVQNSALANSNITVNGTTIDLGSSGNIANFGTLTTNDLTENTNLYYTDARSRAAISVSTSSPSGNGSLSYSNTTGVFTFTPADASGGGITNAQAQAYIQDNGLNGSGNITTTGVVTFGNSATQTHNFTGNINVTGNIEVDGNLNYRNVEDLYVQDQSITLNANAATDATSSIIINRPVAGANTVLRWNETDDKWQFSNDGSTYNDLLTQSQVRGLVSVSTDSPSGNGALAYNSTTGAFTFTPADVPDNTDELSEGSTNLYYTDARSNTAIAAYTGAITNLTGNLTTTANISGNYILGNGSQLTGVTGSTDSFGTAIVAGQTNIQATQANAQIEFVAGTGVTLTTSGNALTINSTGSGGITNAQAKAYIESNGLDATADIDTSVHLGAANKDYTGGSTYWTDNVATTNQFFAGVDADTLWYVPSDGPNPRTRPNIADGSKIVISGGSGAEVALSNGSVTSDNTYYVRKNTPFAGFDVFHLYTDSALSNAVQTGGNVLTNPSELNVSYKAFDVVSNGSVINHNTNTDLQGTLDVTGAITATSTLDVTGNIDTSANINAAGGTLTGVLTSNSNIEMSNSDSIFVGDINGAVQQEVRNETGSTINRGQVVYLTGTATGDIPHIALANNQSSATMPAIGVIKNNIANASVGEVVTSGEINIGTHGLALGSDLFVDAAGGLTVTHPTNESSLLQKIGKVVNSTHIIVQGAFRTNATPNLNENNIFIGNSSNRVETVSLTGLTSNVKTTGNLQINPDVAVGGLKGMTFDATTNRLGLGTTTPSAAIDIVSDGDSDSQIFMQEHRNNGSGNDIRAYKSRGSLASPTVPDSGDAILELFAYGYDGNGYQTTQRQEFFTDGAVSANTMPIGVAWEGKLDGNVNAGYAATMKLRANGAFQIGDMGRDDATNGVNFQVANDGTVTTSQSITATGNVTGNYILGNGSLLSGVAGSTDSFGTFTVSGQTNIQASQANAQVEFAAGSGMTITTSGNTMTFAASGGGSYGNTDVQTWLASGNNVGNIETAGNLIIGGVSANVTQSVQAYFGSNNTGSNDQFQPTSDPGHPNSTPITFSGTTNPDITFLNGNVYYTKSIGGGIYEIYTDSLLTSPVQSGTDNEAPSGLQYEYSGTTDITSTIAGTLAVTGETTLASGGANTNVSGNIVMTAGKTLFLSAISTIGGGTLTLASLRVTDFLANDPLGINSVANSSLSGGVYAAPFTGSIVYVTGDRHGSRGAPCYFDGTSWRYFSDDANVTI